MEGGSEIAPCEIGDLPRILYVRDIAQLLGRTEKAVRNAISRGSLPPLRKVGGRACWLREDVATLQAEIRAGKPAATVKITATPYSYDLSRMLVTFTIKPKGQPRKRVRKVAPEGLDAPAALAWGRALEGEVLLEILGERKKEEPAQCIPAPAPLLRSMGAPAAGRKVQSPNVKTLSEFWDQEFESKYVNSVKPATRRAYRVNWSNHIRPALGDYPLDAIDFAAVETLKDRLKNMRPGSRNQILYKLRTMLKKARSWGRIKEIPLVETDSDPQQDPIIYTESEADALVNAARAKGPEDATIILLMLHGGLRVSEVCALRWGDLDLPRAMMRVQHNFSAGEESTPKGGESAWVGLSPDLVDVLRSLKRGHKDDFVLTRVCQGKGANRGVDTETHHTPHSIRYRLNVIQREAGLEETGPHRLRHSCLTIMARGGFEPWKLQKHARHKNLATTQRYVHLAGDDVAQEASAFWAAKSSPKKKPPRLRPVRGEAPAQSRAKSAKRPQISAVA